MDSSNDEILLNFFKELTKYTRREDALIGIVCGIKDEDIVEFTEYIKDDTMKDKDEHLLLEKFVEFRRTKNYKHNESK